MMPLLRNSDTSAMRYEQMIGRREVGDAERLDAMREAESASLLRRRREQDELQR